MNKNPFVLRFLKYSLIGGSAALIDWGLFYVLAIVLDIYYLLSGTISFLLATSYNYYIGIKFLFDSTARFPKRKEILLVFLITIIGLGISLFFLFLFSSKLNIDLMLSKIMSTFFSLGWNFLMRNNYIFRKPNLST